MHDLYRRHYASVERLCRQLLRDRAEAEDAAQQTFLSAYQSLLRGGGPREPAAWLATIARNECWSRSRARMREPLAAPDFEGESSVAPDAATDAIAKADLDRLWRELRGLPGQQREALLLRELSGLSYEEVGRELGVSERAVDALIVRARRGLKTAVGRASGLLTLPGALREVLARLLGSSVPVGAKLGAGVLAVAIGSTGAVALRSSHPARHRAATGAPRRAITVRPATSRVTTPAPVRRPARPEPARPAIRRQARVKPQAAVHHRVASTFAASAPSAPATPLPATTPPVTVPRPAAPPVPAATQPTPTTGTTTSAPPVEAPAAPAPPSQTAPAPTTTAAPSPPPPAMTVATGDTTAAASQTVSTVTDTVVQTADSAVSTATGAVAAAGQAVGGIVGPVLPGH